MRTRRLLRGDVLGREVLVAGSFADQLAEDVVGDLTLAARGANTGFFERTEKELKRGSVDAARLRLGERSNDPVAVAALGDSSLR